MSNCLTTKLRHFASQENCDGEEYDAMQEAADEIERLQFSVASRDELITSLESQLLDWQDAHSEAVTEAGKQHQLVRRLQAEVERLEDELLESQGDVASCSVQLDECKKTAAEVICGQQTTLDAIRALPVDEAAVALGHGHVEMRRVIDADELEKALEQGDGDA